jgi:crotonobetainyl-CoA:carnitine CoA-transferase CaiB-like acyl-CoA transferase
LRTRGRDELVAALLRADVPAGPVLSVGEAVASMEAAHGGGWVDEVDGVRLAPSPIQLGGRPLPLRRAPPRLGEHTDEVLTEAGFSSDELVRLRGCGAIK